MQKLSSIYYNWFWGKQKKTITHSFNLKHITFIIYFSYSIQSLALNSNVLSQAQKFNLHAIVASLLVLIPNVVSMEPLLEYANKIIEARKEEAPHLLPELQSHYNTNCEPANKLPHLMVDQVCFVFVVVLFPCVLIVFFLFGRWRFVSV